MLCKTLLSPQAELSVGKSRIPTSTLVGTLTVNQQLGG